MVNNKEKSVNNSFITIQARITRHERLWDVEVIGEILGSIIPLEIKDKS